MEKLIGSDGHLPPSFIHVIYSSADKRPGRQETAVPEH